LPQGPVLNRPAKEKEDKKRQRKTERKIKARETIKLFLQEFFVLVDFPNFG
jgi:hypothetical protein